MQIVSPSIYAKYGFPLRRIYLEISIEEIGSGAELQIYLNDKDVFDLIGILHHIQKNMSK